MAVPAPYQQLLQAFDTLPGIGPRAAERLVQFVLAGEEGERLAQAISTAKRELTLCQHCFRYALTDPCQQCEGAPPADHLLVVEDTRTQRLAEEQGHQQLFVLHGLLSPVAGIGPGQLNLPRLRQRVVAEGIQRLSLVLPPGVEADVTTQFIQDLLADLLVLVERSELHTQRQPEQQAKTMNTSATTVFWFAVYHASPNT